jgi:hypothetical protein
MNVVQHLTAAVPSFLELTNIDLEARNMLLFDCACATGKCAGRYLSEEEAEYLQIL